MIKKLLGGILLYCAIIVLSSFSHNFYVSITQIEHNVESKTLEISMKIFTDDLDKVSIEKKEEKMISKKLEEYILKHFEVKINGISKPYKFIGKENENDVTWCYIEVTDVSEIKTITVLNSILTDVIEKQSNIVNVTYNKNTKSLLLDKDNFKGELNFE